mmetsp:Transcript_23144/g.56275  ORF Transcript_23144/g.56275 Transcript_23144/m.56275 type:complete len:451 (-) Transcript_23144:52-1404(-)
MRLWATAVVAAATAVESSLFLSRTDQHLATASTAAETQKVTTKRHPDEEDHHEEDEEHDDEGEEGHEEEEEDGHDAEEDSGEDAGDNTKKRSAKPAAPAAQTDEGAGEQAADTEQDEAAPAKPSGAVVAVHQGSERQEQSQGAEAEAASESKSESGQTSSTESGSQGWHRLKRTPEFLRMQQEVDAELLRQRNVETPRVLAHLRRLSKDIGRKHAASESKRSAKVATGRAFRATRRITSARARKACSGLSRMANLPFICENEAAALVDTLKRSKLGTWQHAARMTALKSASTAAANAGFAATKAITTKEIAVAAKDISNRVLQIEFPKIDNKWRQMEYNEKLNLARKKVAFFRAAAKEIAEQLRPKVKAALWGEPVRRAVRVMRGAAKTQAKITSKKVVAAALAPKFVAAARGALPKAVRKAHGAAISKWKPGWKPAANRVNGYMPDLIQ